MSDRPPVGVEEGDGGGSRVEGDEGGRQAPSKAPGQKALPWDHLKNPGNMESNVGDLVFNIQSLLLKILTLKSPKLR